MDQKRPQLPNPFTPSEKQQRERETTHRICSRSPPSRTHLVHHAVPCEEWIFFGDILWDRVKCELMGEGVGGWAREPGRVGS